MDQKNRMRRLKKYEAIPRILQTETETSVVDYYSPFGPMIARSRLPAAMSECVNRFADQRIRADHSSEFVLPGEVVFEETTPSLADHIEKLIRDYMRQVEGTTLRSVTFETFWVVSQYQGTPSPMHFHSGDVSGVAYLKTPELDTEKSGEEERNYILGRQAGYINFISGDKQNLSKSLISFRPEANDLYIFPAWLLHGAEPFVGRGERRSMAFNAFVEYE